MDDGLAVRHWLELEVEVGSARTGATTVLVIETELDLIGTGPQRRVDERIADMVDHVKAIYATNKPSIRVDRVRVVPLARLHSALGVPTLPT